MRKLFAAIFVLLLANFVFPQIQVNNASLTGSLYGLEYDETYNTASYYANGPYIGWQSGYDFYAVCVIDLSQLGGNVSSVSFGSITLQLDGTNDGSLWTGGYIGDVTNETYLQQVNIIK